MLDFEEHGDGAAKLTMPLTAKCILRKIGTYPSASNSIVFRSAFHRSRVPACASHCILAHLLPPYPRLPPCLRRYDGIGALLGPEPDRACNGGRHTHHRQGGDSVPRC